jgi:hypothetical protein
MGIYPKIVFKIKKLKGDLANSSRKSLKSEKRIEFAS